MERELRLVEVLLRRRIITCELGKTKLRLLERNRIVNLTFVRDKQTTNDAIWTAWNFRYCACLLSCERNPCALPFVRAMARKLGANY